MPSYFSQYITVALIGLAAIGMVGFMLGAGRIIRPSNPSADKSLTYECGVDPIDGNWAQTNIRYYLFALLFVVFDVEAVFVYPWATMMRSLGKSGLVEMIVFIGILAMALLYAWKKGILAWD
ncbi:MAG: NADH-quinone oxidoreductase subunit A [Acidobacteria bacterium]|nr:MAG: NADH-quinone oxidoreductase subunit A [Acidobacteriota bacterium]